MNIATRLKERLVELDWSQAKLARISRVSQSGINKIFLGQVTETRKLAVIAQTLGLNADWLATGEGSRLITEAGRTWSSVEPNEYIAELVLTFPTLTRRDQGAVIALMRALQHP